MVVEVGMSGPGTLNQLRHTAHHWLTQHPWEVRIVLIDINHAQRTKEMEKWEMVLRPHPRSASPMRPGVAQSLRMWLDSNAAPHVQGAPLSISMDLLFNSPAESRLHTSGRVERFLNRTFSYNPLTHWLELDSGDRRFIVLIKAILFHVTIYSVLFERYFHHPLSHVSRSDTIPVAGLGIRRRPFSPFLLPN